MKKTMSILLSLAVLITGIIPLDFTARKAKAANDAAVRGVLSQIEANQYGVKSFVPGAEGNTMRSLDMGSKSGDRYTWGTPENPLLILELVPWQGFAEMGYMIEGCEPVDIYSRTGCYSKEKAAYYRSIGRTSQYNSYIGSAGDLSWVGCGATVRECFADENYPGKGLTEDDPDYLYRWFHKSEVKTIKGYYEKVSGTAVRGNHNIIGLDEDGHPVFGKVEDGQGDFIWVSLGDMAPNYDFHAQKENKGAFAADTSLDVINSAYVAGDREYTTRTEDGYWYMPSAQEVDADGKAYSDLIPKSMFVHYNDFLRYTLCIRTKEGVDNYSIVVKPVEPTQLRDNPQYVDFADLIWIHESSASGIASIVGVSEDFETFTDASETGANADSSFFDANNDIGWEVAEKLYFKANGLAKYTYNGDGSINNTLMDYSGKGQYAYAPVIMGKKLLDMRGAALESHEDTSYYINYTDMTLNKSLSGGNKGTENNFYKFCLMNCLMDQDVFYELFYTPQTSTHQPVIQTINGKGCNTAQEGDAQTFWCPEAFLPYLDSVTNQTGWGTDGGKAVLDQYKIHYYNGSFMNFPSEAILSYTYIYNSDNNIFALASNANFDSDNPFSSGIHAWFGANQGEKASLSRLDVMYFLWHYQEVKKPLDRNPNPSSTPAQAPAATQQPVTTQQPSVSKQDNTKKPAKVASISVKAKKKKLTVSWKKKSDADGYQLQYALNKKLTKKKKTINVRSSKAVIRGLKKNKVYYIRIRAYKKLSGREIYGKWSKVKKVKIK